MIRGIRGAITVKENNEREIVSAAEKLIREMIRANNIEAGYVASVFFSATEDLTAAFPAKALRNIDGWTYVPVMCMAEIPVPSSLKMCVRVMIHLNTDTAQEEIEHIYMEGTKKLRPDL
ncbi:chorismate mutase [Bacillus sp. REN3]|uniref:chorismate mutase n=1 Tax=Bacillus sp. REN3 TaxID=2802440 RepID=UPI001AED390D|nr:chorismate mutase [Bacillus sp. REN3]